MVLKVTVLLRYKTYHQAEMVAAMAESTSADEARHLREKLIEHGANVPPGLLPVEGLAFSRDGLHYARVVFGDRPN